jgi:hypothetical protein
MNIAARAADTINEQLLTDLDNLIEDWRSKTEGKTKVNQLIGGLFGFEGSTPEESKKFIEETFGKAFPTRADWTNLAYEIKQSIPPELRDANSDIWAALKPDAIGLKAVMMEALEKGVVPDEANMNKLKALMKAGVIAGDVDAIYLHIADELISSPERMKMIATVDGIGKDIPDTLALAIRANSSFVPNAVGDMMWSINGKMYEITPTLLENFKNMGIGLPNALSDGILAQLVENDPKNKGYIKTWLVDSYSNYLKLMGLPEMSAATKGVMTDVFSNLSTYLADEDPMGAIAKAMGNNFTPEFKTWITDNFNYLVELINKTKEASKEVDKLSRYKWQGSGGVTIGFTPTKYATGGFPTTGELFYAREGGEVELVGRHGNQSMVANNQQIVTAIRQASAEGYVEGYVRTQGASGGRSDGDTIVVQIGNEVVYEGSLNHLRRQNQRAGRVLVPVRG